MQEEFSAMVFLDNLISFHFHVQVYYYVMALNLLKTKDCKE